MRMAKKKYHDLSIGLTSRIEEMEKRILCKELGDQVNPATFAAAIQHVVDQISLIERTIIIENGNEKEAENQLNIDTFITTSQMDEFLPIDNLFSPTNLGSGVESF